MSNKCTFGQLFNFMSTIENTGETTYDLWRSLEGNEDGTVEEFLSYLKDDIADSELSTTSTNPVQNNVVTEKFNEIDGTLEELTPLHNMNGCIVCNGESVTLTVGEDIEVGQVITFKYLLSEGYSYGMTYVELGFDEGLVRPVMAEGYAEDSITILETYKSISLTGCYFVIVKPISNTVKDKLDSPIQLITWEADD